MATLFILAAGMGSRYGGLKQLDGVGPCEETIMDYSIFDAVRAGFDKVVFVIRKDFEADFKEKIIPKYADKVNVELCFQDKNDLPGGFTCPEDRVKPWGTNHAVMMAKDIIKEPFAVINADDFYGRHSFEVLASALNKIGNKENEYYMVGYRIGNTLSEGGTVSRGVCSKDSNSFLTDVVERTSVERIDGVVNFKDENGENVAIEDNTPVSMNMWGFSPDYFSHSEQYFINFLKDNIDNLKSEFFIPLVVNELITKGIATVEVLDTTSKWFGVTYPQDRADVVAKLKSLTEKGEYPSPLF